MSKKKPRSPEQAELERLRRENYMQALEIAYLKKLRALAEPEERSKDRNTEPPSRPRRNSRKPR